MDKPQTYEISHIDACDPLLVTAKTASAAKYKNYLDWREAFRGARCTFREYLSGIRYCKKVKEAHNERIEAVPDEH